MKRTAFLYTIALGIFWEIAYAFVVISAGLLIAFFTKYAR
jgi:hypothetical protein